MTSPELFEAAVNVVRNMPKEGPFNPSDELKLKFYAFYKQATVGPNNTPKPRFYDVVNLYKWNAWKKLENMPPDEARQAYVDELKKIIETMSLSEDVSQFYELLGPFYEFQNHQHQQQAPHSSNTSATNTRESTTIGNKKASVTTNAPARTSNNTTPPPSSSSSDQSFVGLEMEKTHTTVGQVCREPMVGCGDHEDEELGVYGHTVAQEINAQLALAVFRLQHGMERAVQRLDAIESRISMVDTHHTDHQRSKPTTSSSSRSYDKACEGYPMTAFLLAWPFVVYVALRFWERRRKV